MPGRLFATIFFLCAISIGTARAEKAQGAVLDKSKTIEADPSEMSNFYEHMRRGKELFEDDRLKSALSEFEEAYGIARKPAATYYIGRIHHKLGHRDIAIEYYSKYLKESQAIDPERQAQIGRYLQELGASSSPPTPYVDPFSASERLQAGTAPIRRNTGMLIAGATLLGASYISTAIVGIVGVSLTYTHGTGEPISQGQFVPTPSYPTASVSTLRAGAGVLMIPVVGPFISGGLMTSPAWSVPMMLVSGGSQVAGLVLAIVGGTKRPKHAERVQVTGFVPTAGLNDAGLVLGGVF